MEPQPVLETDDSKITVASVNCWDLGTGWGRSVKILPGAEMTWLQTVNEYDLFRRYMDSIALQNPDLIFLQEAPHCFECKETEEGAYNKSFLKPIFALDENYQKYELVSIHSPNSYKYEAKYGRPDNYLNNTPMWDAEPPVDATSVQHASYFSFSYENMMTLRRKDSPWTLSEGGEHVLITKNCKTKRVSTIQTFKNKGDTEVTIANIHLCGGGPDEKYMAEVWHRASLKQGVAWCKRGAIAKTDDGKLGKLIFTEMTKSGKPPRWGVLRFSDGSESPLIDLATLTPAMETETTGVDFGEPIPEVALPKGWRYRWLNGKQVYYQKNDTSNLTEEIPVAPATAKPPAETELDKQFKEERKEGKRLSALRVEEIKGEHIIDILDKNPDIVVGDFNSDYGVVLNPDPDSPTMWWLTQDKHYPVFTPGFPVNKALEWHRAPYDILSRNNFIRAILDDPNKRTNIHGGITDCVWFSDKRLQEIDGKVLDLLKVTRGELKSKKLYSVSVGGNLYASDHNGIISTLQIKSPVDLDRVIQLLKAVNQRGEPISVDDLQFLQSLRGDPIIPVEFKPRIERAIKSETERRGEGGGAEWERIKDRVIPLLRAVNINREAISNDDLQFLQSLRGAPIIPVEFKPRIERAIAKEHKRLGMGGGKRRRRTNRRRKKRKIRTNIKSRKNKVNRKSRKTKKKR